MVLFSGDNLTSTANLKIPSVGCENCSKKSNSVSFLNVSLRRRNIPSPIFDDDSLQSFNNSEFVEVVPPNKTKSISDELLEVKSDDKDDDTKGVQMKELIGKMYLLEQELKTLRGNLEKSSKKLLSNRQSQDMMIRQRVLNGKVTKMLFTKYDGIKIQ